jgi:hypothetical protein
MFFRQTYLFERFEISFENFMTQYLSIIQWNWLIQHTLFEFIFEHSDWWEYLCRDHKKKLDFIIQSLILDSFDLLEVISCHQEFTSLI